MKKKFCLKTFILSFIGITLVMFVALYFIEKERRNNEFVNLIFEEHIMVEKISDSIKSSLNSSLSDLIFLRDTVDVALADGSVSTLPGLFSNFARSKDLYDQIRYIAYSGDEVVRVNYNDGDVSVVEASGLQNKSDRYYVYKTLDLAYGSVYISPLDLNMENGQVETPHKPMIRLVTPLKDKAGVVVLNFLAGDLIDEVHGYDRLSEGNLYLVNSDGDFLYSNNLFGDFAFMFGKEAKFQSYYPEEWLDFSKEGQMDSDEGFFTYTNVMMAIEKDDSEAIIKEEYWWLVSHIKSGSPLYREVNRANASIIKDIGTENYIFIFLAIALSAAFAFMRKRNMNAFMEIKWKSEYDMMTQILNRHSGIKKVKALLSKNSDFSLIYMDIDGLKCVNDRLGHASGDLLIKNFVAIVQSAIRGEDIFSRLGGDEFILIVQTTDNHIIHQVMERIESKRDAFVENNDLTYNISFSYGIVNVPGTENHTYNELVKMADTLMYENKKVKNRNCDKIIR